MAELRTFCTKCHISKNASTRTSLCDGKTFKEVPMEYAMFCEFCGNKMVKQ